MEHFNSIPLTKYAATIAKGNILHYMGVSLKQEEIQLMLE